MQRTVFDQEILSKSVRALINHYQQKGKQNDQDYKIEDKLDCLDPQNKVPITSENEGSEKSLFLILQVLKTPIVSRKVKNDPLPIPIPMPHSDFKGKICLFVKDPASVYEKVAPPHVTVIGVEKLRKEFKSHELKRQLLSSFDLFLADKRIIPLLPPLLGKNFFIKKKLPIPIKLPAKPERSSFELLLEGAVKTTPLYLPRNGKCVSIRVGNLEMPKELLIENINSVFFIASDKIPCGGFDNIQVIHIKGGQSIALPIYTKDQE